MRTLTCLLIFCALGVAASEKSDPYARLSPEERTLLKPQIERWVRDQVQENWADLWDIQEQTREFKNDVLPGREGTSNMNREQFVAAMQQTMGFNHPVLKAFRVTEVRKERDGFQLVGCAELRREYWEQTNFNYVHIRVENGKTLFGWFAPRGNECKL